MRVPIQMDTATMRFVPHTMSVVIHHNQLPAEIHFQATGDAVEGGGLPIDDDVLVMVAQAKIDGAVQSPENGLDSIVSREGEVTKMVDCILWLD